MSVSREGSLRDHDELIVRFVEACRADERIAAAFVGGSVARGEADQYSDLDLCIVATDESIDVVRADRAALVAQLGTPLFLQDWGQEDPVLFFILTDGTEAELHVVSESWIHDKQIGPIRPLLDRRGILANLELPMREPRSSELAEELSHILAWFWHDVSHFVTALGRGQLWWAAGQVEALRGYCVNLVRIEQGVEAQDEPYWKLDAEISTSTMEPLRSTFVPMESEALARAASDLVAYFRMRAPVVAEAYGLGYPAELERLMRGRLDPLVVSP
jgi:predicted nucleotidyltransferase